MELSFNIPIFGDATEDAIKVGDSVLVKAGQSATSVVLDGTICTVKEIGPGYVRLVEEKESYDGGGVYIRELIKIETGDAGKEKKYKLWLKEVEKVATAYGMSTRDVLNAITLSTFNRDKNLGGLLSWKDVNNFAMRIQQDGLVGKIPKRTLFE
jgi:hypothetical protein